MSKLFLGFLEKGKESDIIELWEERLVRIADLPFTVLLTRIGFPV